MCWALACTSGGMAVDEERPAAESTGMMRWLLTYADMITLLMIFFVILYAFSKTNTTKYEQIALSLAAALHGAPNTVGQPNSSQNSLIPIATTPATVSTTASAAPSPSAATSAATVYLQQLASQVSAVLATAGSAKGDTKITSQGLEINFAGDGVYFASASAVITPQFEAVLLKLAPLLKTSPYEIRVEGFTNDLPLHSSIYPTAWELSAARAVNVLRYLTEVGGVPPHIMEADAFGQWHPQYPNTSPTNLALNRSVDIVVTDQTPLGLDEGGPDVAPPGESVP